MTQTATHTVPELVTLPSRLMLAVDGSGPPESAVFAEAVRSLYATRAALGGADVPLEGSYWQGDDRAEFDLDAPQGWCWTLSVDAPDGATEEDVVRGAASVGASGVRRTREPAGKALRLEHRGPYDAEEPSRAALRAAAKEQGLAMLRPAEVDPSSGYRYYSLAQVPAASTIALLRSLDVPVARIRELLAASDDSARGAVLEAERQRAIAAAERHQRILSALSRLVESPAKTHYDVRIAARPTQRLHVLESATTADHLDVDTAAACQRLDALVKAARAPAGSFVGVFPLDLEDSFMLRVGVPTEHAVDGTRPFDLPGGSWASTLHVGAYDQLPLAYSALLDHVHERGHEPGGVVCESYLTNPDTVAEAELVTALAMPLASS